MTRDKNSMEVPDMKKDGMRYRLATLEILWEKFLAEEGADYCSYAQFTRYTPTNIIKPKPEDWGTCLCMICLNPELKFSALKKTMPELDININNVHEKEREFKQALKLIEETGVDYYYLELQRNKENKNVKQSGIKTTYFSQKTACSANAKEFAKKLDNDVKKFLEHLVTMRSQYRRIRQVKTDVMDHHSKDMFIRIDWSENVDLYQTRQEKSQYYTSIFLFI